MTPVAVTCLTFEKGMRGSNGVSLVIANVVIKKRAKFGKYGRLAMFNGKSSKIRVPSLANTYRYDLRVNLLI